MVTIRLKSVYSVTIATIRVKSVYSVTIVTIIYSVA